MSKCKTIPMSAAAWREALDIEPWNAPGETVQEIANSLGIGRKAAEKRLKDLVEQGKCNVGIGTRVASNGKHYHPAVYELVKPCKK